MINLKTVSIPFLVLLIVFGFSVYEGAIYLSGEEPDKKLGLGIFSLEFSMLLIDGIYFHFFDEPDFSKVHSKIFLILVALGILFAILKFFHVILKKIETVCVGDKKLKIDLRRIKSILILLIPLEIFSLLNTLNWRLSDKGMLSFLGENMEIQIWNVISIIKSLLFLFLIVYAIKYINSFREVEGNSFHKGSQSDE